jgi:uncharacterized damage-inducible protein DinB
MEEQEPSDEIKGKADLLERMQRSYAALEGVISPLDGAQLSRPGRQGWSIKDHLAHLATWEVGIVRLLQGRPRYAAMQVEGAIDEETGTDAINELIYYYNLNLTAAQAVEKFRETHREMLEVLEGMSDQDLLQPYMAYLPPGEEGPQEPVLYWINGNTFEHFDEHRDYIGEILAGQGDEAA